MSGNEYENSDTTDDECYDTYYDDTDPFQDDNNNNYTTNINANDPEQFEYKVSLLNEVQARFEPSTFSSSYIHTSSIPDICSICFKNQTNFESLARYTLMYTYPYAYYQEDTVDRTLFENIQAQLEVEIENLSYQIERSTTHNRGDIENQRHIVERRRQTLLLKYFPKSNT
ncbi:unnamed protein product [Rotaria sp. Silwood2]|nr:unnamed protein product [Rotaria sp. Silwood2]